ncbi:hypothetical protein ACFWDF_30810 [Streptomyces diastaticus]|uniref:hypothetical protein n=1 Tax=Streptomyces diastaticus TaxID=1956 RepID=UPI0036A3B12D
MTEPRPADQPLVPAVWVDGHPQLEAIAAAVWEQCDRSDSGLCVEDDPRSIAVAALAAVHSAPATPAAVLREAADRLDRLGLRDLATQELRRLADEAETGGSSAAAPAAQCTAGLLPFTSDRVHRCVRHGAHDSHETASGARWGNGSADEPPMGGTQ